MIINGFDMVQQHMDQTQRRGLLENVIHGSAARLTRFLRWSMEWSWQGPCCCTHITDRKGRDENRYLFSRGTKSTKIAFTRKCIEEWLYHDPDMRITKVELLGEMRRRYQQDFAVTILEDEAIQMELFIHKLMGRSVPTECAAAIHHILVLRHSPFAIPLVQLLVYPVGYLPFPLPLCA